MASIPGLYKGLKIPAQDSIDNSGQKGLGQQYVRREWGECGPPTRGHKLGKKKISGNIVGTEGHNLEEEHAWPALSEREYSTRPAKYIA